MSYREPDPYLELKELKRAVQKGMKANGYKIRQKDITPLESYTKYGYKFTYIMFIDKRTMDVYRMWFNKHNYTMDHHSCWEVDKVGPASFDLLLDPV